MTSDQVLKWMVDSTNEGNEEPDKDDRYIGIFLDHVEETSEILGYFKEVDPCARFLGTHALLRKIQNTDFLYARFWKKTFAEYHLYAHGMNLFHDFSPLKSWIIVMGLWLLVAIWVSPCL